MAWRKNFLDDEIKGQSVHGLSIGGYDLTDPSTIIGGIAGGLIGGPPGAVAGAGLGAHSAKTAREQQAAQQGAASSAIATTREGMEFQKWLFGEQTKRTDPFVTGGTAGMEAYMRALGFTKSTDAAEAHRRTSGWGQRGARRRPGYMVTPGAQTPQGYARPIPYRIKGRKVSDAERNRLLKGGSVRGYSLPKDSSRSRGALDLGGALGRLSGPIGGALGRVTGNVVGNTRRATREATADDFEWIAPKGGILPDEEFEFGVEDLELDPGYQFRKEQGMEALESSALADAGLLRGDTAMGLMQYGQEMASQEYGAAYARGFGRYKERFDRRQTQLSNLWNLATMGSNVSVGAGTQAQQLGSSIGQGYSDIANIQAAMGAPRPDPTMQAIGLGLQAYDVFKN